jgi:nitrite reductase (NADH) large subunit
MVKTYVVIGASAAGLNAAVRLRELDSDSKIICISAENELPYNRCLLADLLANSKNKEELQLRPKRFFNDYNIDLRLETRAEDILVDEQKVCLNNGSKLGYDKLFLGTGCSASVPAVACCDCDGVFSFDTLDDILSIQSYIKKYSAKTAVVVGAGITGIECADALNSIGIDTTIVIKKKYVLSSYVDESEAVFLEGEILKSGVAIVKNVYVNEVLQQKGRVCGLSLSDGIKLKTNLVVFATGVTTNTQIAGAAGIKIDNDGICVLDTMQTNAENIYAGGDVCRVKNIITGELIQSCLWPDAVMQGFVAAQSMVGLTATFKGAMIVIGINVFGKTISICNAKNVGNRYLCKEKKDKEFYHKFLLDQNHSLKGFVMVGNISGIGRMRKFLISQDPFDFLD